MRLPSRCWPLAGLLLLAPVAHADVFINELHYDDSTPAGDTGEAIEVVATAGETLSGYALYLYNGSTPSSARVYDSTVLPVGSPSTCGGQVRIAVATWPTNGIQNGPNDGIALVDSSGQVVQFISYEGTITAADGPAAGMTSQNIPVSETNSTPPGTSLQLTGSGSAYAHFSWAGSATQTFGTCNNGQTFNGSGGGTGPNTPPSVITTIPGQGASTFPAAGDLVVEFSEVVSAGSGAFTLTCGRSGQVALQHPASASRFTLATNTALEAGEACRLDVRASRITDADGARPAADTRIAFTVAASTGNPDPGNPGNPGDYYSRVNTSSPSQLRCSLHETIKGHTAYPYSGSGTSTWTILEIAEEDPANPNRILDAYRNRSYAKGSDRAGTGSGITYNREHTWPNSLGFASTTGDKGLPYAPYTDTHMLYLTDTQWNADRGNKPFADCDSGCGERATEANNGVGGGTGVFPGNSNWVRNPDGNGGSFQVWGKRKGDMARAVMYMAIRYEGGKDAATGQSEPDLELTNDRSRIVRTSSSPAYMGLLSTLLAWHQADPPDDAERARNEVIYSFQGNRNPFIDHPEWGTEALFTSSRPTSCQLAN